MIKLRSGETSILFNENKVIMITGEVDEGFDTELVKHVKRYSIHILLDDGSTIDNFTYDKKEHTKCLNDLQEKIGGIK